MDEKRRNEMDGMTRMTERLFEGERVKEREREKQREGIFQALLRHTFTMTGSHSYGKTGKAKTQPCSGSPPNQVYRVS